MDNLTRELIADALSEWATATADNRKLNLHAEIGELLESGEFGEQLVDCIADALAAKDLTLTVIDK